MFSENPLHNRQPNHNPWRCPEEQQSLNGHLIILWGLGSLQSPWGVCSLTLVEFSWWQWVSLDLHPQFSRHRTKEAHVGFSSQGGGIGHGGRACHHLCLSPGPDTPLGSSSLCQFHPTLILNLHGREAQCWLILSMRLSMPFFFNTYAV